jgi:NAD+ diphosphatase
VSDAPGPRVTLRARFQRTRLVPRSPNVFAGPYLDRLAQLRKDEAWLEAVLRSGRARIVPIHDSRNLVTRTAAGYDAVFLDVAAVLRDPRPGAGDMILLGQQADTVYFAVELPDPSSATSLAAGTEARFEDLRTTASQLPAEQAGVLAYARAMLYWRQRHRHCGACGAPTLAASAGHVMKCTNAACAMDHFPRLDPAIIVLVTDGERALLGRQAAWPEGRYSTIAGFVEPGESLEDAVAREVLEETGVRVLESEYHSSQPWPFPSSLMVGFMARAAAESVPRADEELEDVRWFTREQVAAGFPGLPPPQSVSFRLIEHWYDSGSSVPLRATPGLQTWGRRRS